MEETVITMPVIALRGLTVFPLMMVHFDISRKKSVTAVEKAMVSDQKVFLVTQKRPEVLEPGIEDLYHVGTIATLKQLVKMPNGVIRAMVEGIERAALLSLESADSMLIGKIEPIKPVQEELDGIVKEAMVRVLKSKLEEFSEDNPKIIKEVLPNLLSIQDLEELIDQSILQLSWDYVARQEFLEAMDTSSRYETLVRHLITEIEVGRIKQDFQNKVRASIGKNQKEYILREQMQYIREELGENNANSDVEQFLKEVDKLKAKPAVKDKIRKEITRYKNVIGSSSESAVERAYIETLLELPWDKASKDSTDLVRAEKILNEQHYGLEKVKERMLEFLAVRMLTGKTASQIVCLVGPPGTGKTSVAKSVAEALHRQYVRICLGGVRDEAEIRGHRKTYVGAMPGRVAAALKQAGVRNPLMLLDEIDKLGSDYKGDPSSALLEVLDGEQNYAFRDHYVEIPIDLSEVFFIATANTRDGIPRPLLDRMEIIEVNSYTANEKFHIAKDHLVEKALKKNGIKEKELMFSDEAIRDIIRFYTREAGVRGLERQIGAVCRKEAREILGRRKAKKTEEVKVTPESLEHYLGKPKYRQEKVNEKPAVGIVRGLAWTSVGGDTLEIEVNMMPGEGKIDLTGQMGDVMKESARTALSYVRSVSGQYKIADNFYKKKDFHIHIPEGAVPKDGPSAGVTMATALLSAVTQTPVRADLAMTGEITLRGRVLPIGGLKEKILAAKMAEVKTVLVPGENEKDIEEISEEIKEGIEILFVETMEEVAKYALLS